VTKLPRTWSGAFSSANAVSMSWRKVGPPERVGSAHLRQSRANAAAVDRQAFLLSRPLGLDEQETKEKLAGMLRRHEEEWDSFVDALEPRSFVAQWIARGQ